MSDLERAKMLSAESQNAVRAEAAAAGVKGLFLANGGGAVALLAFLQAVWKDGPELLVQHVVVGVGLMAFGLALAAPVNFFRYHSSLAWQGGNADAWRRWRRAMLWCRYMSIIAFLVACGVVVIGAWHAIPARAG